MKSARPVKRSIRRIANGRVHTPKFSAIAVTIWPASGSCGCAATAGWAVAGWGADGEWGGIDGSFLKDLVSIGAQASAVASAGAITVTATRLEVGGPATCAGQGRACPRKASQPLAGCAVEPATHRCQARVP